MNEFFNKKLQKCKNAKLFFLTTISALAVGCNEDDALMDESPEEAVQTYEFFELAKGDTLPKYIHREKPNFIDDDDIDVICTTMDNENENGYHVKNYAESNLYQLFNEFGNGYHVTSLSGGPQTYISDIRVEVAQKGTTEMSILTCPGYNRLPVDLNEGAGGAYLYLCYKKTTDVNKALTNIRCTQNSWSKSLDQDGNQMIGASLTQNDYYPDLNMGAGGNYIYLQCGKSMSDAEYKKDIYNKADSPSATSASKAKKYELNPITDLCVISTKKNPKEMLDFVLNNLNSALAVHLYGDTYGFKELTTAENNWRYAMLDWRSPSQAGLWEVNIPGNTLRAPHDLNCKAGGKYIYLLYKVGKR